MAPIFLMEKLGMLPAAPGSKAERFLVQYTGMLPKSTIMLDVDTSGTIVSQGAY